METQTETKQVLEKAVGDTLYADGKKELVDRVIKGNLYILLCTISKTDNGISEKSCEKVDEKYKHVCTNHISTNHPRYLGLLDKLNKAGL